MLYHVLTPEQKITPGLIEFTYQSLHIPTGIYSAGRLECDSELTGYKALNEFNYLAQLRKQCVWLYFKR